MTRYALKMGSRRLGASALCALGFLLMTFSVAIAEPGNGAASLGWRMDGDGKYLGATPPTQWSATEGVVWSTPLPATSNGSPVLLEEKDLVIVTSDPDTILALRASDGSIVWSDSTGDLAAEPPEAHEANGWTTATPVTDGRHVFAVFGSGVVAAYDLDGARRWARLIEPPKHRWGHSASPVLGGGRLIVHVVDLIGLDPKSGEEVWRAPSEASWGSPIIVTIDGTEVVITPGGDVFRADDGTKIATGIGKLRHATPVVEDGILYFLEKKATAVRLPKTLDGPFKTLWTVRLEGYRHYPSSVIHNGLAFALSRERHYSVVDIETGEVLTKRQLDIDTGMNSAYASLTLAGDYLYASAENGTTVVLDPKPEYREVARNTTAGLRSSIVFAGKRMYVRTFEGLTCFGE